MSDYRTCGACYESVHKYASVCPHCHSQLVPEARPSTASELVSVLILLGCIWFFFGASPVDIAVWVYKMISTIVGGFLKIFFG